MSLMALQLCAMRPSGKLFSVAGLTDVAIYPDHRRRGIADQMLRAAIGQAKARRADFLALFDTAKSNWAAGFHAVHNPPM